MCWSEPAVPGLDKKAMEAARRRLDCLTKPRGSLGFMEEIAVRLAGISGDPLPRIRDRVVIVMAADHGVARQGVSLYPQEVTAQMVLNFLRGGAAINVLARHVGARIRVVDMGVARDVGQDMVERRKVGYGTGSIVEGPAMSREQALACLEAGMAVAGDEADRGADLLAMGEMGIGNTTASSAVLAALSGAPAEEVVGAGTGVSGERWRLKVEAVNKALCVNRPDPQDPLDVLAKLGGFEIGGLAGCAIGAAVRRRAVVIDGFISSVAALLASRLVPAVNDYMFASHTGTEPGHGVALSLLGARPFLLLDMRLGEGTGAALGMFVIEGAARLLREMATFEEAGVAGSLEDERG